MHLRHVVFVLSILAVVPASAATATFINELHYDNSGSDVDEGVEIAGLAGTDLSGWQLALYNGSTGGVYADTILNAVLPDLGGGFGALFVPMSGMQNGAPDGVALVDAGGAVVQFLSYEGSFTATAGVAAGLISSDIGVFEDVDSPAGTSLQLTGTGLFYEDFSWMTASASSYGAINAGQQFAPVPLPASFPLLAGAIAWLLGRHRR